MNIERYAEIGAHLVDADNLFFSVVAIGKEKGMFDETTLEYIDRELSSMISETARLCGKGYIKEDAARTMLSNIFMILGTAYSRLDIGSVLSDIRERKLSQAWKRGTERSISAFNRSLKNIYHLEHLAYRHSDLKLDFAVRMKGEYGFSNVFTHSFGNATFTKAFFALKGNEDYGCVCRKLEILCVICDLLCDCCGEELQKVIKLYDRENYDGSIKYTMAFLSSVMISALYSAFYRCGGLLPQKSYAGEILGSIMGASKQELESDLADFLKIFIGKHSYPVCEYSDSVGENILNVYSSRVCEENLALLAQYLADFAIFRRSDEKALKNLIIFE